MNKALSKMKFMKRAMGALDKPRLALQGPPKYQNELIKEIITIETSNTKADIVYSTDSNHAPTCIMIHGGGLFYGSKELNLHASVEMAKRGFNVVNLDYPLLEDSPLPEQIESIYNSLNHLITYQDEYHLDMNRVVMMGDSAGAYLSLVCSMILNRPDLWNSFNTQIPNIKIKAIGLICIMGKIKRSDTLSFLDSLAFNESHPSHLIEYLIDPTPHIKNAPPCYVIGSEEDFLKQDTLDLIQACVESHHLHESLFFKKGASKPLFHVFPITFVHFDESQQTFNELRHFFNAHLNPIL
jgi:acetyl esterase